MRAWRFPAVVVVPAALIAAFVVPGVEEPATEVPVTTGDDGAAVARPAIEDLLPTAAAPGARGSTWYCAGGTATGDDDGAAEQTVVVTNAGAEAVRGTLTVVPDEGEATVEEFSVEARSREPFVVSEVLEAEWASVLIEVEGGEVAVEHQLAGPTGRAVAPCAASASAAAWFPTGATAPGSREVLAVFNPFPDEAVIRVTFETESGARTPEDLEARVVPARSLLVLDLGERVAVRTEVATSLTATTGQVVVDRIQVFDGSDDGPLGLAASLAAPFPASRWWFPGAEISEGRTAAVVIQNPDASATARVDVAVLPEGVSGDDLPVPFAVDVPAGRYVVVPVEQDGRVPVDTPFAVEVSTREGAEVVAELTTEVRGTDGGRGVAYELGAPVAAGRWLFPQGSIGGARDATIEVANPGDRSVRVTVAAITDGERRVISPLTEVEVPPRGRRTLDVEGGRGFHPTSFELTATGPVVAGHRFLLGEGGDVATALGIPLVDTVVALPGEP